MIKGVILDLDGTVYRGKEEVPGAAQFVAELKRMGVKCLFVTNRANRTPEEVHAQLKELRISCRLKDVFTSAQATVQYLKKGSVFAIGEEGLRKELKRAGLKTITEKSPDYVIVSLDRSFNYEKLKKACRFIREGAMFIATNPDRGLPTDEGTLPGSGSIVAAVAAASGVEPFVIGKPQPLIIKLALKRLGLKKKEVINVGDNVETDIPAGENAGVRTAFMLTGFSTRRDLKKSPVQPTWILTNYKQLLDVVRKENR